MLEIKFALKQGISFLKILFGIEPPPSYHGLFYRRKVIEYLNKSDLVKQLFFIRTSYSASTQTIQGDAEKVRSEFISSIKDADFALAVRGDGNYSLRFYEILSLGRIPLYIDTDGPLPLEDEIDYDSFMMRVNYKDIERVAEIVSTVWKNLNNEDFVVMQQKAREVFETKLRADLFYRVLFEKLERDVVR